MFHPFLEKVDRHSRFTEGLLLILAIFTGTFFVYRDFGIRMIFGFGAVCVMILIHLLRRLMRNRPPVLQPLHLPYLALSLVILLNFLRPGSRHDADSGAYVISMLISCALVLLAAPDARESCRSLNFLYHAGLFMAAFVVFFTIFEDLFWNTCFHLLTPTAQDYLLFFVPQGYAITLGGCSYTNYILFIGMAVCCGSICRSAKWTKKSTLMLLSYLFILLALMLVGRRGELLGALVCSALLVLAMCTKQRRRQLIIGGAITLAVVFGLTVLFLPVLKQVDVLQRYVITVENLLQGKDITTGRVALYKLALKAYREHPLVGIGWDQFYTLVPAEFLTDPVVDIEDVHCIYLQFLCETGTVATFLIIAPLIYYYYQVCAQFKRLKHRRSESKRLTLAFDLCVNSFLLQSFLLFVGIYDPNFQRIIFWCFYSLAILMMIAALRLEHYRPADPVSRAMGRAVTALRPVCSAVWQFLRTPWKEGT